MQRPRPAAIRVIAENPYPVSEMQVAAPCIPGIEIQMTTADPGHFEQSLVGPQQRASAQPALDFRQGIPILHLVQQAHRLPHFLHIPKHKIIIHTQNHGKPDCFIKEKGKQHGTHHNDNQSCFIAVMRGIPVLPHQPGHKNHQAHSQRDYIENATRHRVTAKTQPSIANAVRQTGKKQDPECYGSGFLLIDMPKLFYGFLQIK